MPQRSNPILVGIVGDFDPKITAHRAIDRSMKLGNNRLPFDIQAQWIQTDSIPADCPEKAFERLHGIWVAPGSPYQSFEGALAAIHSARLLPRPFLGTCGGFQHALIEYFRNVLGISEAGHEEISPGLAVPAISRLSCPLVETEGRIRLSAQSRIARVYGAKEATEAYHCRFGLDPRFESRLANGPLQIVGRDDAGEVRAVELNDHPFFVATLFQPERAALHGRLHPLVDAFLRACKVQTVGSLT